MIPSTRPGAGSILRAGALALFVIAPAAWMSSAAVRSQGPSSRLVVIASDLHMGAGKDRTGQWLPIEDFRWSDDFKAFIGAIQEAGKGATDLVLNGDTFELWQSTADDCPGAPGPLRGTRPTSNATGDALRGTRPTGTATGDARLGCTEEEALARLDRVLAAHAVDIGELAAFARNGTNRLILVPGDHDAALLFPSVAARVVTALKAPGRVEVSSRGYWLSPDGAVYAEHGHQIAGDPYAFTNWPEPFVRDGGRLHLERSAGDRLVQTLYNRLEARFPILDNFAQEGGGVKYAPAADPTAVPAGDIASLLMFLLARPVWQQFRLELDGGDVQPPDWDLDAVRRGGAAFLADSLLPDDRFRPVVDELARAGQLSVDPGALTDRELIALCDSRAALRRSRRRLERSMTQASTAGRAPTECPRTPGTRGSAFDYFWRSRDVLFSSRLDQVRAALIRDGRVSPSIKVFAHGHTHLPAAPIVPARAGMSPLVVNSGAWQRTVTPFQIEEAIRDRGWSAGDVLRQLQPEQLPACYGLVWIDPYVDEPRPRLRFWRSDGRWGTLPRDAAGMATACGGGAGPSA